MSLKVHYREIGGALRTYRGKRDGLLLRVGRVKQLHSLYREPIFPVPTNTPVFEDWESFQKAQDPPPELDHSKEMVLVEWDNFWPVADKRGTLDADGVEALHLELVSTFEEAYQRNAVAKATTEDTEHFLTNAGVVVSMVIAALVTLSFAVAVMGKVL